jgi:hypothetical protein
MSTKCRGLFVQQRSRSIHQPLVSNRSNGPRQSVRFRESFLLLFAGSEGRLPSCCLLAWRGGNYLDLLFFRFLGFPIASLLTFGHVDLLGVDDDTNNVSPGSDRRGASRSYLALSLVIRSSVQVR